MGGGKCYKIRYYLLSIFMGLTKSLILKLSDFYFYSAVAVINDYVETIEFLPTSPYIFPTQTFELV